MKMNFDLKRAMDYAYVIEDIEFLLEQYPFLEVTELGTSIRGRRIPMLSVGEGEKAVLYVGTHHAMEWITTAILLKFVHEYCELYQTKSSIYRYSVEHLFHTRKIFIVPMLNPDGVEYQIHGVSKEDILYDRLLSMNGGSEDFTHWQANARGVDLNHNYNSGFAEYKRLEAKAGIMGGAPTRFSGEMPESEPETGSLCNLLRFQESIQAVLTLHTQGEEIFYTCGEKKAPRSEAIGKMLTRMTGYPLRHPDGMAAYGGLTDWCIEALGIPSFTLECGKGENPLPPEDAFGIYAKVREALFLTPTLI